MDFTKLKTFKGSDIIRNQSSIALLLLIIGVFILDYLFILKPQLGVLKKINPQLKSCLKDSKQGDKEATNFQQLSSELKKSQIRLREFEERLVSEDELVSVIGQISRLATNSEVKIMQMTPHQEMTKSKISSSIGFLPISIQCVSSYHAFGRFLSEIENSPYFLELADFQIVPKAQDYHHHGINLTLKVYTLKE